MKLSGKVAIVSGAARGLGHAVAEKLAAEGCKLLAFDRQDIQQEIKSLDNAVSMKADVSRREDVEAIVARAAEMGEIAVLVNNASTCKQTLVDAPWEQVLADWDDIMDTNLKGVLLMSRAVVPHMKAGGGCIINVSTSDVLPAKSDTTNPPDTDLYNASKWALNGFTDAWAKYLKKCGIRVNGLCMDRLDKPGWLAEVAQLVMDIIASERSGENFGAWAGEHLATGEPPPMHRRITG